MSRAFFAALALGAPLACTNTQDYPFSAYPWDSSAACLEQAQIIDVIQGAEPAPCDSLRCWISPGSRVYVTDTACVGPADYVDDTTDRDGASDCGKALAAYRAAGHTMCPPGTGGGGAGGAM